MDRDGRLATAFATVTTVLLLIVAIGALSADISDLNGGPQAIEAVGTRPNGPAAETQPDSSTPNRRVNADRPNDGLDPSPGELGVEPQTDIPDQTNVRAQDSPSPQSSVGPDSEVSPVRPLQVETDLVQSTIDGSQLIQTTSTLSAGLDDSATGPTTSGLGPVTGDRAVGSSISTDTVVSTSGDSTDTSPTTIPTSQDQPTPTHIGPTTTDAPPASSQDLSPSASSPEVTKPNPASTASSTASSATRPPDTLPTTTTPQVTTEVAPTPQTVPADGGLATLRNNNPSFDRNASTPSEMLNLADLTEVAPRRDNGTVGDGQFRAACQYSHFSYDDPIVFPGQPGEAHLHMFFGNTETDAFSTTDSIVNSGGGSCNGFELNRSAYWTPAVLDGGGNIVVPDYIILYYKSKFPEQVQRMPQGLKMVSGNTTAESFTVSESLYWSCGGSGGTYNKSNRIPDCGGDTVNATIGFPQCWDGVNMDSVDHRSHMAMVNPHEPCPPTHPVRLPQISILLYYPGDAGTKDWFISSDQTGGFNTSGGATLHGDWWGGWNDEAMDLWTDGCMKAARNCSFGQTGTDRQLAKLNDFQNYPGPNVLPLP